MIHLIDCPNCSRTLSEAEHDHFNREAIFWGFIEKADFQDENASILGSCPYCEQSLGYASDNYVHETDDSWDEESEILNSN